MLKKIFGIHAKKCDELINGAVKYALALLLLYICLFAALWLIGGIEAWICA